MRNFDYEKLKTRTWDNDIISYVAKIHEYKGKQDLYLRQKHVELKRLGQVAKIQSTEASNRIEGIVTTNARLRQLIEDKTSPHNREESEILGYRDVLNLVHESYEVLPLSPSYILQMHLDLLKHTTLSYSGCFKTAPNEITAMFQDGKKIVLFRSLDPYETPDAIASICESYNLTLAKEEVNPLILIPCFILDFLCIHPFNDGNGRMSRLLTLLLLYKNGYMVGQYISIEKAIADTKEDYYDALAQADSGWHEEENNPIPFIKYMLGIILYCYRDFENRVTLSERAGIKSNACDIVKEYVSGKIGAFTKQEALISCPSLGSSSVEASLKKLVAEGMLTRIGSGRKTRYVRSDAFD